MHIQSFKKCAYCFTCIGFAFVVDDALLYHMYDTVAAKIYFFG